MDPWALTSDTYYYFKGDGQDVINDNYTATNPFWQPYTVSVQRGGKRKRWVNETRHRIEHTTAEENAGNDTLVFGENITLDQVNFFASGADLVIGMTNGDSALESSLVTSLNHKVTIRKWAEENTAIETFAFDDGTQIDTTYLSQAQSGTAISETLTGTTAGDLIAGLRGNDVLNGGKGNDYLIGGTGNDKVYGGMGDDDLFGNDGNDLLRGYKGDDYLIGGAGHDELYGEDGNDVLIGSAGNDFLAGGMGDDTYFMARGSGLDTINEINYASTHQEPLETVVEDKPISQMPLPPTYKTAKSGKSTSGGGSGFFKGTNLLWINDTRTTYKSPVDALDGGVDTLQFAGDIHFADLIMARSGNDMVIQLAHDADMQVADQVVVRGWVDKKFRIDTFAFENGFEIDVRRINGAQTGTSSADVITANGLTHVGDEAFLGMNNAREAWLAGGGGEDTIIGSRYSDILIGGEGNDTLRGGFGDDSYVFGYGSGHDVISDFGSSVGETGDLKLLNGEMLGDKIIFDVGISIENIAMQRVGNDFIIYLHDSPVEDLEDPLTSLDTLTVRNWQWGGRRIETLQFMDGLDLDIHAVATALQGADSDDMFEGTSKGNWIAGGAGLDNLKGKAGNDYLLGQAGDDYLQGDEGDDFLSGGGGNDLLVGGADGDFLSGDDGADYLDSGAGDDVLIGGDGNDVLADGEGDDILIGGAGNDTYRSGTGDDIIRFGYGDGSDTYHFDDATSNEDVIVLEGKIEKKAVWFKRSGRDLEMQLIGSSDSITFNDWFKNGLDSDATVTNNNVAHRIHSFVLGDETLLAQDVTKMVNAMAGFNPYDGLIENGVLASKLPDVVTLAVNDNWKIA